MSSESDIDAQDSESNTPRDEENNNTDDEPELAIEIVEVTDVKFVDEKKLSPIAADRSAIHRSVMTPLESSVINWHATKLSARHL